MEYTCTKKDTVVTTIIITTLTLSATKPKGSFKCPTEIQSKPTKLTRPWLKIKMSKIIDDTQLANISNEFIMPTKIFFGVCAKSPAKSDAARGEKSAIIIYFSIIFLNQTSY